MAESGPNAPSLSPETAERRAMMALAAAASAGELAPVEGLAGDAVADLRPPEIGLIMVRGRIGGAGRPFNLGEATVTRAAVRLDTGETGLSHVLGRDRTKARRAALLDALWARAELRPTLERDVLAPIRSRLATERQAEAEKAAATRVDFFTLVRGDD